MAKGFTFNNRHSSEFNITMKSINRPMLPETSDHYIQIPGQDGTCFFPGNFKDNTIEIECSAAHTNTGELRQKVRSLAAWLYTRERARLIFDDEPGLFHMAKICNQIKLEQICALGRFMLQFRCMPFAFSMKPKEYSRELKNGETVTINNEGTAETPLLIEVQNPEKAGYMVFPATGAGVCPDIRQSTLYSGLIIKINGQEVEYLGAIPIDGVLKVYSDRMKAGLNGGNVTYAINSNYPKLLPGSNLITYVSGNSCPAHVKVIYQERWL